MSTRIARKKCHRGARHRLIQRKERDADRRGSTERFAGGREFSGGLIDSEFDDVVGVLILGKEEFAGGIDCEVARFLAAGGYDFYLHESAVFLVDAVHGERIVAAIGGVEEFAAGVQFDFG